jgi:hypothetical protein
VSATRGEEPEPLATLHRRRFARVVGVDFSGAARPGRTIWIATCDVVAGDRLRLQRLQAAETAFGVVERRDVLRSLVEAVVASQDALWGMDFPFALPVEIAPAGDPFAWVAAHDGDAYDFGRWCVAKARTLGPAMHIRRVTDRETRTPFDCYHYRIVCQTFHGIRDVLIPLRSHRHVAIAPFDGPRSAAAGVVAVEACPGSTLKRLALPHNRYKQTGNQPVTRPQRAVRKTILAGIEPLIDVPERLAAIALRNPGGDALDAILAAAGAFDDFRHADHAALARHDRYPREGRVFA